LRDEADPRRSGLPAGARRDYHRDVLRALAIVGLLALVVAFGGRAAAPPSPDAVADAAGGCCCAAGQCRCASCPEHAAPRARRPVAAERSCAVRGGCPAPAEAPASGPVRSLIAPAALAALMTAPAAPRDVGERVARPDSATTDPEVPVPKPAAPLAA
jgi:hypothetical protein